MVKVTNKAKSTALAVVAKKNVTVVKKDGRDTEVLVQGTPLDHAPKHGVPSVINNPRRVVGLSKGVTISMGDYQSLRVDCWLMDFVDEDETQEEALDRISAVIDERVNMEVAEYPSAEEIEKEIKPKNKRRR